MPASVPRWTATLLVLVLLGGSPGAVADDPGLPGGASAERAPPRNVDDAIHAGVQWLREQQREDGSFPLVSGILDHGDAPGAQWAGGPWDNGVDALCIYTLSVCGVGLDDLALERGFENLRRHWKGRQPADRGAWAPPTTDGISTYFVSLCLLALDAAYNRAAAPLAKGPPDPRRKGKKLLGKTHYKWAQELVAWLEAAQDPCAPRKRPKRPKRSKHDARRRAPSRKLPPSTQDGGAFGYGSPAAEVGHLDHSNSQFAMLGLKAASRLGLKVSDISYLLALRHFLATQETEGPEVPRVDATGAADPKAGRMPGETHTTDDAGVTDVARGWRYMCPGARGALPSFGGPPPGFPAGRLPGLPPGAVPVDAEDFWKRSTPAMTAGGVSTLVICRSELDGCRDFTPVLRKQTVRGIRDGLAWLARHLEEEPQNAEAVGPPGFDPRDLPPGVPEMSDLLDDFYFLYGLERACILGGVGSVGGHAWYDLGAERIVKAQRADGSFLSKDQNNGNGYPTIDSCFALLFLKRAVFRVPDHHRVITPSD